jgi:ACR3 family arsenite efflux pump ArsB
MLLGFLLGIAACIAMIWAWGKLLDWSDEDDE